MDLCVNEDFNVPEPFRQSYCPVSFILFEQKQIHCITAYVLGNPAEVVGICITYDDSEAATWGLTTSGDACALSFFFLTSRAESIKEVVQQKTKQGLRLQV